MKNLFAVLIVSAISAVFAQNPSSTAQPPEPYHIKNDVLGESISTYRQNNPECSEKNPIDGLDNFHHIDGSTKLSGMCMTIEGAGTPTLMTYASWQMKMKEAMFWEDRFAALTYLADHGYYTFLRDNLVAKFGPPTSKSTRDLQNRVGAHFVGESLLWDNGVSSIQLEEYSGDLDSSSIDFTLDDYRKWQEERHKQAIKKPSPDM